MMTPLQRYLFDTTGYLHIKNPLTSDELTNAQDAVCRYIDASADKIPFGPGDFLPFLVFDKALENPALHPSIWPIITELTGGKPRMLPSSHLKITTHKRCAFKTALPEGTCRRQTGASARNLLARGTHLLLEGGIQCDYFNLLVFYRRFAR